MKLLTSLVVTLLGTAAAWANEPSEFLKATKGRFHMGVAINASHIQERNPADTAVILSHFDSITPENELKWERIHPEPNRYNFELADKYVEFGQKYKLHTMGHTLLWHSQVTKATFVGDDGKEISKEALAERLREHIRTVVGRYKGKIDGWDVVNEAIDDSGKLRTNTPWYKILGEDAIRIAFKTAHEADPEAELYYNDYSLWNTAKRKTVLDILKRLRAEGLRIDGVGLQEHYGMTFPDFAEADAAFRDFVEAGFDVMVTELDMTVLPRPDNNQGAEISRNAANKPEYDPYKAGLPHEVAEAQAKRYAEFFKIYLKYGKHLKRVTFWGFNDGASWLNGWPIRGRTDHALLFDRQGKAKPAVEAITKVLKSEL